MEALRNVIPDMKVHAERDVALIQGGGSRIEAPDA
jgi:hypothetical protein